MTWILAYNRTLTELPLDTNGHTIAAYDFNYADDTQPIVVSLLSRGKLVSVPITFDVNDTTINYSARTSAAIVIQRNGGTYTPVTPPPNPSDQHARDIIKAMLKAGTNMTVTADDTAGTLTLSSSGAGGSGPKGDPGLSAYQVALANGYVGTQSQWLSSLIGATGSTGPTGATGADGLSAYQVAVNNGFVGTQTQWLASLVGPAGPSGTGGSGGPDTVITVAASDTPAALGNADYTCDGTADDVQIQAALDAVGTNGGEVILLPGTFNLAATVKVRIERTSLRFIPGARVRWTSVTGRVPLIQVLYSNIFIHDPYVEGSGTKGNGIGIQIGGQASTEPIVGGDQPNGVHVYRPRATNLDTAVEFGVQSDGTFSTGDCVVWGGRLTNCKIGVRSAGFVNHILGAFISGINIGIQQTADRNSGKIIASSCTINQWADVAIDVQRGRGILFRDIWMEHTATQSGIPTECIRAVTSGSNRITNLTFAGTIHIHGLPSSSGTSELWGIRLGGNVEGMTAEHLEFTNDLVATALIRQDSTHVGNAIIKKVSFGDTVPAGYSHAMLLSKDPAATGRVVVQEVPGPVGSGSGYTVGGNTPTPSRATYYVDKTGNPNSATYWAKDRYGHVAWMEADTTSSSGLIGVWNAIIASNVHIHFGPGRYHTLDAPLGTEAWANTNGLKITNCRNVIVSGEGEHTILSMRSNTIQASPDLAMILYTNSPHCEVRDMQLEMCGAYMSTMETLNCNQGHDYLIDRVKVNRSKSTAITFDGGDVGKFARGDVIRHSIFAGRPHQPQVDLVTTGGTLTNADNYQYAVAFRDADLAYYTGVTASVSGSTATLTTATPHGFAVGETVVVQGMSDAGYNGQYVITAVGSTTTFSYTVTGTPAAGTGGVVTGPANTKPSDPSFVITPSNSTSKAVVYLPIGPYSTLQRIVYRYDTVAAAWKQVQVISDNTTTSWTDTGVAGTTGPVFTNKSNIPHSGIQLLAATGALIEGNTVDGCGDQDITGTSAQGIRLAQKQSKSCDLNIVTNNRVRQSGSHCIYLVGAKKNTVTNNVCSNPGSVATKAQALRCDTSSGITSDDNILMGNRAYDDQTATSWSGGQSMSNVVTVVASSSKNMVVNNHLTQAASATVISDSGTGTIVQGNVGHNPQGPAAIAVTASPFTYTAGSTPEAVYISGGTVSSITKSGTNIGITSGSVDLEPGQAIVVTYTAAPTMVKDRK